MRNAAAEDIADGDPVAAEAGDAADAGDGEDAGAKEE